MGRHGPGRRRLGFRRAVRHDWRRGVIGASRVAAQFRSNGDDGRRHSAAFVFVLLSAVGSSVGVGQRAGPFNVDTSSANFLDEDMFYSPMGDMYMLQANSGEPHPLLPPGPGLYVLEGDGLYELLADEKRDEDYGGDDESWLSRSSRAGGAGHWDEDVGGESTAREGTLR